MFRSAALVTHGRSSLCVPEFFRAFGGERLGQLIRGQVSHLVGRLHEVLVVEEFGDQFSNIPVAVPGIR